MLPTPMRARLAVSAWHWSLGAGRHQRGDRHCHRLLDSIPIVVVSGQVPTPAIGLDAFQEVDAVGITRPCVKHNSWSRTSKTWRRRSRKPFTLQRPAVPARC